MKSFTKRTLIHAVAFATLLLVLCSGCGTPSTPVVMPPADYPPAITAPDDSSPLHGESAQETVNVLSDIPEYDGNAYMSLSDSPSFSEEEINANAFEYYSDLDALGRCGAAFANVCRETMPTAPRESISSVTPSGWVNAQYDFVDGGYIYNRCHLIGFQLTAENANEKNLITGTRYLNIEGMLPFENMVADYVQETGNHVLYRVTPVFKGDNLVASGVQMEGWSVEDEGAGICFDVYCHNVQPGAEIDYVTGETKAAEIAVASNDNTEDEKASTYVLNTNTKKFHLPSCDSVMEMSEKNRQDFAGNRNDLLSQGYKPCGRCKP